MKIFESEWLTSEFQKQCQGYLARLKNGESAEQIAVSIYMSLGKSEETAKMMVSCIRQIIADYHQNLSLPIEEIVKKKLDEEIEGVTSVEERGERYHRFLVTMGAYEILNSGRENAQSEAYDFVQKNKYLDLGEEEFEQKEQDLRTAVEEAFLKTNIPIEWMEPLFTESELSSANLKSPAMTAKFGEESADLKLILCTQVYVNSINGCYGQEQTSISLEEIVNAVCTGVDLNSIAGQLNIVDQPSVALQILEKILRLLYCVLVIAAFLAVPASAFMLFAFCMSIPWAIACTLGLMAVFYLVDKDDAEFFKYVGLKAVEAAEIIFEGIFALFKLICKGIKAVANFALDLIIKIFSPDPPPSGASGGVSLIELDSIDQHDKDNRKENDQDNNNQPIYKPIYI